MKLLSALICSLVMSLSQTLEAAYITGAGEGRVSFSPLSGSGTNSGGGQATNVMGSLVVNANQLTTNDGVISIISGAKLTNVLSASGAPYITAAEGYTNNNLALSRILDFSSITNGRQGGLSFTYGDTLWYPLYSSSGVFTNQAIVTNGTFVLDTRTTSNGSVYLTATSQIPVIELTLTYSVEVVNPSGTIQPQFVILLSSNSFGSSVDPFTLNLTSGLHTTFDGLEADLHKIDAGVGAELGGVSWTGNDPYEINDNKRNTLVMRLDKARSLVSYSGDGIRGTITNAVIGDMLPWETNQLYVCFQQYIAGTTNLKHLLKFHTLGMRNRAAADAYDLFDTTADTSAKLGQVNTFRANQFIHGDTWGQTFYSTGTAAGVLIGKRAAVYSSSDAWEFYSGAEEPSEMSLFQVGANRKVFNWNYYGGTAPFFAPADFYTNIVSLGTPTNRFATMWVNDVRTTNVYAGTISLSGASGGSFNLSNTASISTVAGDADTGTLRSQKLLLTTNGAGFVFTNDHVNTTMNIRNVAGAVGTGITIDSTGDVGINQSNPDDTLDVNGTVNITGTATVGGELQVNANAVVTGNAAVSGTVTAQGFRNYTNQFTGTTMSLGGTNATIVTASNIYLTAFAGIPTDTYGRGSLRIVATGSITVTNLGALKLTAGGTNGVTSQTLASGEALTIEVEMQNGIRTNGWAVKN